MYATKCQECTKRTLFKSDSKRPIRIIIIMKKKQRTERRWTKTKAMPTLILYSYKHRFKALIQHVTRTYTHTIVKHTQRRERERERDHHSTIISISCMNWQEAIFIGIFWTWYSHITDEICHKTWIEVCFFLILLFNTHTKRNNKMNRKYERIWSYWWKNAKRLYSSIGEIERRVCADDVQQLR